MLAGFITSDTTRSTSERYSPYGYKYENWAKKTEPQLYSTYHEMYLENPLATLLVDYVVSRLGRFELAGTSKEEVDRAWKILDEVGFMRNYYQTIHQMVLNGTGIMVKNDSKGRFRRTDTAQWTMTRDLGTGVITYTLADKVKKDGKDNTLKVEWAPKEVNNKQIAVFRVLELPDRPEGISMMRASLPGLAALHDLIFRDLPAGVHNFLTVERIMQLPLDGYNSETEQKTFMQNMRDRWANRDPSSIGITILDDKVKVGYMGNLEGTGQSQRVMDVYKFIEPILAVVMMNFMMPLGLLLQTGANKSIILRQQQEADVRMDGIHRRIEEELYLQCWKDLGLDYNKVWILWPKSDARRMDDWTMDREMFERKLVSKEYVLRRYDIIDTGKTFYEGTPTQAKTNNTATETPAQSDRHSDA